EGPKLDGRVERRNETAPPAPEASARGRVPDAGDEPVAARLDVGGDDDPAALDDDLRPGKPGDGRGERVVVPESIPGAVSPEVEVGGQGLRRSTEETPVVRDLEGLAGAGPGGTHGEARQLDHAAQRGPDALGRRRGGGLG